MIAAGSIALLQTHFLQLREHCTLWHEVHVSAAKCNAIRCEAIVDYTVNTACWIACEKVVTSMHIQQMLWMKQKSSFYKDTVLKHLCMSIAFDE